MPDIYDLERRLKISLTEGDYEDYKKGDLSDAFYARRTDGSIANRVDISSLDDNNDDSEDEASTGGIDVGSFAVGCLTAAAIVGGACGIKQLWDGYKAKKKEAQVDVQRRLHLNPQGEEYIQTPLGSAETMLSLETAEAINPEQKSLTQEEVIQELVKIIAGMAEIADGKKKVSEGVENLSNAGVTDRTVLLGKLSNPKVLESFNAYLEKTPQFVINNQTILNIIFGRTLTVDGQYIPVVESDIKRQLRKESR